MTKNKENKCTRFWNVDAHVSFFFMHSCNVVENIIYPLINYFFSRSHRGEEVVIKWMTGTTFKEDRLLHNKKKIGFLLIY